MLIIYEEPSLADSDLLSKSQMWHKCDRKYEAPSEDRANYSVVIDMARQAC